MSAQAHDLPLDGTRGEPLPIRPSDHQGAFLLIYADALDDLERVRIATANRARALNDDKGMSDTPEAARMFGLVNALADLEHKAELELKRGLRNHPLGAWVKAATGIGEKQGGRLLAAIGDPYWHSQQDRPRTVSELWAYCGYHVLRSGLGPIDTHGSCAGADPSSRPDHLRVKTQSGHVGVAPSRRRGQRANWNAVAKMRAFLVAESCMKQMDSPYRKVYEAGREKYADAVHPVECRRCGPSGNPAQVGSPLSAGHQHARALRLTAKEILRDLWTESKRLHETAS